MKREISLLFALACYIVSIACIAYSVGFLGNILVPRSIDAAALVSIGEAATTNLALLVVFALQHSGMARGSFRAWLGHRLDPAMHRSVYVLTSSIVFILVMALWQPMGGIVWAVQGSVWTVLIMTLYGLGWILMLYATLLLNHFELFGLRQAWVAYEGGDLGPPKLRTPGLYRRIRHPIYLGWLMILWAAPIMTVTHLVLAAGMTIYILIGIQLEERDLELQLPEYYQYKRKVPMLLPSWRKRLQKGDIEHGNVFEAKARCLLSHERRGRLRHRFSLKF